MGRVQMLSLVHWQNATWWILFFNFLLELNSKKHTFSKIKWLKYSIWQTDNCADDSNCSIRKIQLSYLRDFLFPLGTVAWWKAMDCCWKPFDIINWPKQPCSWKSECTAPSSVLYFLTICFSDKITRENISIVPREPKLVNTQILTSRLSSLSSSHTPLPTLLIKNLGYNMN